MRLSDYLAIFVIIALTYLFVDSKLNPNRIIDRDTTYIAGKTTHDTLWNDTTIYIDNSKTVLDTFYVDSSGTHANANFVFKKDSVEVKGKVYFDEPKFSFSNIVVKYPYRTIAIKQTDTLKVESNDTKGFFHGPIVGIGYGIKSKDYDFFVGYGFQWRF